ncbi:MAG: phage portal protein [Gordonia sp. (in: high G+C Gram-positive bacteria)]|nr:MAG: phage portal protein [Gordonia sp. (in: high G+C Gram-positive bacteria)]
MTRYIESKDSGLLDMSAIGQLPPHALGLTKVSNISDTTLAALESAKERKSDEITTSFGESHEQAFRLAAYIDGDTTAAADFASEVKWRDASARSYAATVDALGKLGQMLGVPDEFLWEFIPGWTRETVNRAVAARRESDPLTMLYDAPAEPSESAQPMSSDLVTGDLTDAG